jgi:3-deoxy-D-manno-octulosonate 8-phosphate phosphatase (KDO 8-P phosphatase)
MVGSQTSFKGNTLFAKASRIRLVLSDCDGVLTDGSVYYGAQGELMKCFNIRDGMGVERLRNLAGIETGIITGELSESVKRRSEKLQIKHLELGCKDKAAALTSICQNTSLTAEQIAYIGDDVNDIEVMKRVGLSACPSDAVIEVRQISNYVCHQSGGRGAFREFAELILNAQNEDL